MNNNQRINKLCRAIVSEAVDAGFADLWDGSWNPESHVDITLTVTELRMAAKIIKFKPTKEQIETSKEASNWAEYIEELDGVE